MRRYFNTEGVCIPDIHYMVRIDDRLDRIKRMYVDREKYFVINRGRQYGKTTTLKALEEYLEENYLVIAMDFQMMSMANFANEKIFVTKFIGQIENSLSRKKKRIKDLDNVLDSLVSLKTDENVSMDTMFERLSKMCKISQKPIVLMIDEVDSASNNQVFIDFLAQLRGYYLDRENRSTFHSVIFAGVYDIKKLKLRTEEEHQYNSPWNIAADFDIDMNFSTDQITDMLG